MKMSFIKINLSYLLCAVPFLIFTCINATTVQAEQYSTGTHTISSAQGQLTINVGHVSHFNAHDFFVYSFMFKPKGSKEWYQVPRVEREDDPKMLFTVQTKHSADMTLFDAKIATDNQKIQLVTANMETGETLADEGPVTLTTYDLVKLDDYERWVFLRKDTKKIAPKASVGEILENATKPLRK